MADTTAATKTELRRYRVRGMDCPKCAAKIRTAALSEGAGDAVVSTASQILSLGFDGRPDTVDRIERAVEAAGYDLTRIDGLGDDGGDQRAHMAAGYKRALWIVVLLNVGYGIIEMIAGFVADSQALKADALDFIGDGLITFLGVLAIGWSLAWRARSALIQGVFLGILGVGVIIGTIYRTFVLGEPQAELMGLFGLIALVVNLLAAYALLAHRDGDSNVRAVWLFSRNDAIGNAAIVVAAGLVAWTATPWPDIVVAFMIAGLFLHSAYIIITDARRDLAEAS